MQCPLVKYSCCCLSPKIFLLAFGVVGLVLGIYSAIWPRRSIVLYQRIMEGFNWKVQPLDETREVRNTVFLGLILALLSAALCLLTSLRY